MTTIRRFCCDDLFTYNNVNLDHFTETYNLPFYLHYLATWPEYCALAEGPGKQVRCCRCSPVHTARAVSCAAPGAAYRSGAACAMAWGGCLRRQRLSHAVCAAF